MISLKRVFDFFFSLILLFCLSPVVLLALLAVFLFDFHSPIYLSSRVGMFGKTFPFLKIRSMIPLADQQGSSSTSSNDVRLTFPGRFIRAFKFDEIPQFVNVLFGQMSVVGPRPQVPSAVETYTNHEVQLLSVKPGITDFASIVFSDESDILSPFNDADKAYDDYIRAPKTDLALFYIKHSSFILDVKIILLTLLSIFNRPLALLYVSRILRSLGAPPKLVTLSLRRSPLLPTSHQ